MMKGKLIVFEGGEGGGKTTQIKRLSLWLKQILSVPIMVTREPGGTQLGLGLRQLLLNQQSEEGIADRAELLMYAADRAQHVESCLRPALANGAIILCDRFTDSTVAYQGYGRGLDLTLIHQLNEIATGGLQSDLTLWLDLDVELGLARTKARGEVDRIEQADLQFHHRVREGFRALATAAPGRLLRIEAGGSEAEVSQEIQTILTQKLIEWEWLKQCS